MKINYKSDFEFDYTLLDEHGQATTPPDFPWKLVLSVGNPLKPYVGQCGCANGRNFVAEYDGENYHNCVVQNDVIRVFVDNHGLPCGQLWATFITYTPNPDFPDGDRRVYTPQATDTFLVAEAGDDPTPAQIQYTANYVLYDAYYIAAQNGYEGTPEAYYAALVALPTAIGQAVAAAELAEQAKRDALEASSRATQAASAAEGAVRDANAATETANAAAATANRASETAGNAATTANSAAESATQVATTIQRQYDETMIVMNNQINELIEGKALIASALTDRGYPTQPTDSSASMAQKIEDMEYGAGWLAQLGYTEQIDAGIKADVVISLSCKESWEQTGSMGGSTNLRFFPYIDTSGLTAFGQLFAYKYALAYIPDLDFSNISGQMSYAFRDSKQIRRFPKIKSNKITTLYYAFAGGNANGEVILPEFWVSGITNNSVKSSSMDITGRLYFALLVGIGTNSTNTSCNFSGWNYWGTERDDARQSLVDSLLTYSFDRATAEYSACTITLHANTLARLTQEEIAAITAKGYTLTS